MILKYRAEIDGLRAIAVLSVVCYHTQISIYGIDWFEGGYLGVDIFFVISGYLITRIILAELRKNNQFSFINFYERRARRILPMLLLIVAICLPIAWQKLLPIDLVDFSKSALSTLGFGSNFYFYYSTTEYGADSALLKPLLHTWSLGIEEQFYIIAPIIFLLIWKFVRSSFLILIIVMFFLSIQFAEVMNIRNSELNFFLPFSRFWELLIGSSLAFIELKNGRLKNSVAKHTLPVIGLLLIGIGIFFFDSNTPHPSFQTLIPIIGVVFIIIFCSNDDLVGKVLSFKPIVSLGLISYSLYLWHFPILAFNRINSSNHSNYDKLELILLAIILSAISYFVVEKPLRNKNLVKKTSFYSIIALCYFLIFSFSVFFIKTNGHLNRYNENLVQLLDPKIYEKNNEFVWKKKRELTLEDFDNTIDKNKKKILVIGDSNSGDFINVLLNSKIKNSWQIVSKTMTSKCIPFFFSKHELTGLLSKIEKESKRQHCYFNHKNVFWENDLLNTADSVIFAFNWRKEHLQFLKKSNEKLVKKFGDKFFYVGSKGSNNSKKHMLSMLKNNQSFISISNGVWLNPSKYYLEINKELEIILEKNFLNWHEVICTEVGCPIFQNDLGLYLYDGFHLSKNAAKKLGSSSEFNILINRISNHLSK